jgi:hypothetical protein
MVMTLMKMVPPLLDTSAAVATVTSQVTEAAASGQLEAAVSESAEEVAQEYGDAALLDTVANVTVDPTRIEMTDYSPTASPTVIAGVSSGNEAASVPIVAMAAAGGAILLLAGLSWLFYHHHANETMNRSHHKTLSSVSSPSGDSDDDIESRFHDFSKGSPVKQKAPGSVSSASGRVVGKGKTSQVSPSHTTTSGRFTTSSNGKVIKIVVLSDDDVGEVEKQDEKDKVKISSPRDTHSSTSEASEYFAA